MIKASLRQIWLLAACVLVLRASADTVSNSASATAVVILPGEVTVRENADGFTLANGVVTAHVDKENGRLVSLKYRGEELLGHGGGYWSFAGRVNMGSRVSAYVRVNPATNSGALAEVVCRFALVSSNYFQNLEVEYHYALGRGDSAVYATAVFHHEPGHAAFGAGEGRYAMKLNPDVFDYMTVDADRRRVMPSGDDWDKGSPLNLKEARRMTTGVHKGEAEHKYDYSAVMAETPAYGWSSTAKHVGLWFINPSQEYIGGGPTKAELTGHLDVNPGGLPTLLNMWLGSHYGGTAVSVGTNENWTKVVGPFLIYCNAATNHEAMWKDALKRADRETTLWPYVWAVDEYYPAKEHRAILSGRLVLRDALAPNATMSNVWVGVSAPDYTPPPRAMGGGGGGRRWGTNSFTQTRQVPRWLNADTNLPSGTNFPPRNFADFQRRSGLPPYVDWQRDAKFYQYWTRADGQGNFTIPDVRAGTYTLHAIADGVLGEYTLTNVTVATGQTLRLGELTWTPFRFGRTVWEIGVPDRTAREFRHGDHYWQWGLYFDYPKEFPKDVDFVIGQSDWRRDWNYVQPPRIESRNVEVVGEDEEQRDDATATAVRTHAGDIRSSTWAIRFQMTNAPQGKATLRLAFCGTHQGCNVEVLVNGRTAGETGVLPSTSAMQRDGIRAYWIEKAIAFDASLLKSGDNTIQLLSHANTWSQGVMYDYLRLEVAEAGKQ